MKKQSLKQPLRESLIKIGGGHLLKENKNLVFDYMEHLGAYIKLLSPNIRGWKFGIDRMAGSWEWYSSKFKDVSIFATWGWEGRHEIPLETSDGDVFKAVKLKLKASESEDEQNLKRDAIKYINAMKKEFPKIQKKILEY